MRKRSMSSRPLILLLAFTLILLGAWYKERENRADWEAQLKWQGNIDRLTIEGGQQKDRLVAQIRSWWKEPDILSKPNILSKIEAEWNDGKKLPLRREGEFDHATWVDPIYNQKYMFKFREGRLVALTTGWGTGDLLTAYPQPTSHSRTSTAESIRSAMLACAVILWFVLYLGAMVVKDQRWLEQGALLAALTAGAAWLTNPMYSVSWHGIFSNDSLFYAVVMLVLTGALMAARRANALFIRNFRFSLKKLLFALTAVAILLALGPVGFVALAVMGLAGLVGFLWSFWARRGRIAIVH